MPLRQQGVTVLHNKGMDPLRLVIDRNAYDVLGNGTSIPQDHLECGHLLPPPHDIYGPQNTARRRCWKCAKDMPADVEAES